jgi:hypothetical protein
MLMQLVCVDRRYQRMNCFNIRELQGNLKRKFFTDLVNSNDHRDFLNQSILGMRFKNNNNLAITPDMEAFYNFGTTNTPKSKSFDFTNTYSSLNSYSSTVLDKFSFSTLSNFSSSLMNILSNIISYLKGFISMLTSLTPYSLVSLFSLNLNFTNLVTYNLTHFNFNFSETIKSVEAKNTMNNANVSFNSENISASNATENISSSFSEISNTYRFNRFSNPLISYDYKCGHYLGI